MILILILFLSVDVRKTHMMPSIVYGLQFMGLGRNKELIRLYLDKVFNGFLLYSTIQALTKDFSKRQKL